MGGYAFGAFTDGLFSGISARHGWENRKDDKKRQARLDEINDARERRAQEAHDRQMRVYDRNDADWARQREDEEFWRETYADAANATDAAVPQPMGALPPDQTATVDPARGQQVQPTAVEAVAANLGIDLPTRPRSRAAEMMQQTMPISSFGVPSDKEPLPGPRRAEAGGAPPIQSERRIPRTREEKLAIIKAAREGRLIPSAEALAAAEDANRRTGLGVTYDDWREMDRTARAQAGLPTSEIGGQLYFDRFSEGLGPKDAVPNQIASIPLRAMDRAAGVGAAAGLGVNGALWDAASGAVRMIGTEGDEPLAASMEDRASQSYGLAGKAYREGFTGTGAAKPQPQNPASSRGDQGPSVPVPVKAFAPDQDKPQIAPIKADAKPSERAGAATAVQALDQSAPPASANAAAASVRAMDVAPTQRTITDAQYQRGSQAWMEQYMKVGAPKVLEAMIARGEFDKAAKFQEFMQSAETRAGMRDWSIAAAAATLGDMDKFGKHIIRAYNRMGYFPDGITLDEKRSGFTKGQNGEINGAHLVFRDEATGHSFEQVFNGPDDLIRTGITLLAPENAFESYWQMQQAARESEMGAIEKAQKAAEQEQKTIQAWAKTIYEGSKQLDGTHSMTPQQAMQQAAEMIRNGGAAPQAGSTSGPPVAYRPN